MVIPKLFGASALLGLALAQSQLDQQVIQLGSTFDGTNSLGAEDDQSPSDTDDQNFADFCAGQTLTNGLQHIDGSCNGIG